MRIGLVGKKCGMTRIYQEDGTAIPVTVIEVLPNRITQVKTPSTDGYSAVQVTVGEAKRHRVNKALAGHFAKAGVGSGQYVREFALSETDLSGFQVGNELKIDCFAEGQFVDVSGVTRGKGFAGVVKRHHFRTQDASHGNSVSHRVPGSIGQRQSPGRVFKNKRMAGHLGNANRTILSQKVVRLDYERNLIMISGAVPGAPQSFVVIRPAIKKQSA